MNIREQFGKYLLLKKLSEDSLGETFRAGRVGPHGMEQVVLLRVFNGSGIDGAALTAALNKRKSVHQALVSPNIGNGVDLGEVRGVPYVAYDYISGKDLSALQEQAKKRNHPIPSDHALLIAERIALGLAVGYETRLDDDRVLHGCVLPQLVMISNEGETRLLGFEAAPGLRQIVRAGVAARPLLRYLSPEARGGAAPHKSDDVYSLGAILLELLSGQSVPSEGDLAPIVDQAELSSEGTPLPDDLKRLLKQSLCPQAQRMGDVITWHKALSRMMFEGQYNPTTFNLAFFMHNLFRDDIEKESREIEVEKTMELQTAATAPPTAPRGAATAAAAAAAVKAPTFGSMSSELREPTGVMTETAVRAAKQKQNRTKIMLAAAAALVVAGIGAAVMFMGSGKGSAPAATPAATQAIAAPAAAKTALQQQAVQQQAEAQRLEQLYQQMLEKQGKDLQAKYDEKLASLQKEMEGAKQRAEQAKQAAAAAPAPHKEPPVQPAQSLAAAPSRSSSSASRETREAAVPVAPPTTAATVPPAPAAQATAAAPADPAPALPTDATTAQGVATAASPPRLLSQLRPTYPVMARSMRKEATVVVRVLVDETGHVAQAELKSAAAGFGFDQSALQAARAARFSPATQGGNPVKMWVDLPIKFQL